MYIFEFGAGLDFYHYPLNHEVAPFLTHDDVAIPDIDPYFAAEIQPGSMKLKRQGALLDLLLKTWPQAAMNLSGSSNNAEGDIRKWILRFDVCFAQGLTDLFKVNFFTYGIWSSLKQNLPALFSASFVSVPQWFYRKNNSAIRTPTKTGAASPIIDD